MSLLLISLHTTDYYNYQIHYSLGGGEAVCAGVALLHNTAKSATTPRNRRAWKIRERMTFATNSCNSATRPINRITKHNHTSNTDTKMSVVCFNVLMQ